MQKLLAEVIIIRKGWIYAIVNKVNNKMYIGQTIKLKKRIWKHFGDLKRHEHNNCHLQSSFDKYGISNFVIKVIEENIKQNNLSERERFWISFYDTYEGKGYNQTIGGNVLYGEDHPMYGEHHTQETKEKLSKYFSGKNHPFYGKKRPKEVGEKISKALTGNKLSEEHIEKLRVSHKGQIITEEQKQKIRSNMPDRTGKNNPMFGKKLSEARKEKLRKRMTGENNPFYGKHHTEETKDKIRESRDNLKTSIKKAEDIIKEYYNTDKTQREVAQKFNLSIGLINKICNGNHWTYKKSDEIKQMLNNVNTRIIT